MIVAGTSLKVQPFASVIDMVSSSCPRLLFNRELCGKAHPVLRVLGIRSGFDFGFEDNVIMMLICLLGLIVSVMVMVMITMVMVMVMVMVTMVMAMIMVMVMVIITHE
eukprot:Pgem_evm1s11011